MKQPFSSVSCPDHKFYGLLCSYGYKLLNCVPLFIILDALRLQDPSDCHLISVTLLLITRGAQIPGARSPHNFFFTVAPAIGKTPVRRFLPVSLLELRTFRRILHSFKHLCIPYLCQKQTELALTIRRLMSYIYIYIYIYGAPILDVSRSHTTTQHSR